jgi:hypothetical protein
VSDARGRRPVARGLALAGLLASAGLVAPACIEQNAYLELTLHFPADPRAADTGGPRHAVVRVNTGDVSFDTDWESSDALPSVALDGASSTKLAVSVEGTPENETTPVRVKVRFCRDPSCVGIDDDSAPEVRYEIERAFYLGERTSLALTIDCIPNVVGLTDAPPACAIASDAVVNVPKCEVAGCRNGVTSSYCSGGKHFCEP